VTSQDREVGAAITEDGIARFRLRIGIPVQLPPPFNSEAHPDTMRHYASGFGDDNPLYSDAGYGARSSWRTVIGAPFYVGTLGRSDAGPMPPTSGPGPRALWPGSGSSTAAAAGRCASRCAPATRCARCSG
jgi:hypothetical protein